MRKSKQRARSRTKTLKDETFLASLDPVQRTYFLERLQQLQSQSQEAMREISRGLGAVSQQQATLQQLISKG